MIDSPRLLAGLSEVLPWLKQWHDDVDPATGDRLCVCANKRPAITTRPR